ncbi:dimethyladenosine transferase 2, mitochondrial [Diaphorina citri]|uniref:rRNA adenine N(6)-methyltransferase n=1 Tax=Diaphorina citri TaxID=121845 RepID=A0A1S3CUI4_DIACI|nr:dimethyladenosine transferase 2, mitochondrial [Diaphorina citri]
MIKTKVYNQSFYLTRSVIQYLKSFQSQHYSTVEATTQNVTSEENSSFKTSKRKTRDSVCKDLVKYLTSHNPSLDIKSVPETYLTKRKSIKTLYLANSQTAAMVAKLLKPHIHQCKAEVIECRPGLGLLTDHLLNMKITKLNLHEPDPFFYQNLLKLGSKDKVKIFNNDMVQIPKYNATKRKPDLTFDYIEKKNWEDECIFQLIATLTNQDFLRYLLRNFTNQDGLLSYGRPLMYLFITPSTYQKLIAGPHQPWNLYKPLAVLFQIIFNIELLSKVDRNAFIPWPTIPVTAKKTELKEEEPMYLIKVEGKRDVYQKLGKHNAHRVNTLQKFVTHVIGRKKQRVIPTIE